MTYGGEWAAAPAMIRALLDRLRWSQARLAREVGVTDRAVKYWLAGDHAPTREHRAELVRLWENSEW